MARSGQLFPVFGKIAQYFRYPIQRLEIPVYTLLCHSCSVYTMLLTLVARAWLILLFVVLGNPILNILHLSIVNRPHTSVGICVSQQHIAAMSTAGDNSNRVFGRALQWTSRSPGRRRRSGQPRVDLAYRPHQALRVGLVPPTRDLVDVLGGAALGDTDLVFALGGEPQLALALDIFLGEELADDALTAGQRSDSAPILETGTC